MKKKKTTTKNPFTLLEIIICLCLLAFIGSVVSIKGYELLMQTRIAYSKKKFQNEIHLTKCLASSYKMDIDVHLIKKKNKVQLIRMADSPPSQISVLFNTPINLPYFPLEEDELIHIHPNFVDL